jgi:hypothetical protein
LLTLLQDAVTATQAALTEKIQSKKRGQGESGEGKDEELELDPELAQRIQNV